MKRILPLLLAFVTAFAFAQNTTGRASGIKASDLKRIRAMKLRFLVPTHVPAGYKVQSVKLEKHKDRSRISLDIVYRKGGSEIAVQQTSEGIGDLMFDKDPDSVATSGTYTFRLQMLKGKQGVDYQKENGKPQWIVNWIELPGKSYPRFVSAYGRNSEGRLGVEIMESLRYLK